VLVFLFKICYNEKIKSLNILGLTTSDKITVKEIKAVKLK